MKCVFCDEKMKLREMSYENRWGKKSRIERAHAYVCDPCDRIVFTPEEAKRLQALAQNY